MNCAMREEAVGAGVGMFRQYTAAAKRPSAPTHGSAVRATTSRAYFSSVQLISMGSTDRLDVDQAGSAGAAECLQAQPAARGALEDGGGVRMLLHHPAPLVGGAGPLRIQEVGFARAAPEQRGAQALQLQLHAAAADVLPRARQRHAVRGPPGTSRGWAWQPRSASAPATRAPSGPTAVAGIAALLASSVALRSGVALSMVAYSAAPAGKSVATGATASRSGTGSQLSNLPANPASRTS